MEYLTESNLDGLIHYPGLPNETLFQELDQVFGLLKTMMERNRKRMFGKLLEINEQKANVHPSDIGVILFGGEHTFDDGSSLYLESPFDNALDQLHLLLAPQNCGYVPATPYALESGKLRHEIVMNEYGELDEDLKIITMTKCLIEIEKTNHR